MYLRDTGTYVLWVLVVPHLASTGPPPYHAAGLGTSPQGQTLRAPGGLMPCRDNGPPSPREEKKSICRELPG